MLLSHGPVQEAKEREQNVKSRLPTGIAALMYYNIIKSTFFIHIGNRAHPAAFQQIHCAVLWNKSRTSNVFRKMYRKTIICRFNSKKDFYYLYWSVDDAWCGTRFSHNRSYGLRQNNFTIIIIIFFFSTKLYSYTHFTGAPQHWLVNEVLNGSCVSTLRRSTFWFPRFCYSRRGE